jgi:hypothetical protein
MSRLRFKIARPVNIAAAALLTIAVAGCAGDGFGPSQPQVAAPVAPAVPAHLIAGRWGLAAYHRDEDRARTEQAARGVCGNPYVILPGQNGGVVMHLADRPEAEELVVKGAAGNRTFVGPPGEPGGPQDREIIAYDGQIMIMRWMDSEVSSRYGTTVFARCDGGATAGRPPASRPAPARTNR